MMHPTKDSPSLEDYRQLLHTMVFITDITPETGSFYDITSAVAYQQKLYHIAKRMGPEYMRAWHMHQCGHYARITQNDVAKKCQEARDYVEVQMKTGDTSFDDYVKRVRAHDWYYDFSDDISVYRNGKKEYDELKRIANERGGMYLTYFNYFSHLRSVG